MAEIATRWHKLEEAVNSGRVKAVVLADSANEMEDLTSPLFDREAFKKMIELMRGAPRFVIHSSFVDIVNTDQAMMSLGDMMVCGMLRLPFPECVVEYSVGEMIYHVMLREAQAAEGIIHWYGSPVAWRDCGDSDYSLAFPCQVCLEFDLPTQASFDTDAAAPSAPTMRYSIMAERFVRSVPNIEEILEDAHVLAFKRCFVALLCAVLLPQTLGLKHEEVHPKASFNKARLSKGKSAIPAHTVISLGSYRTSSGSTKRYAEAAGIELHLRRAHKRRIAVGPGKLGREWRFFPAQVVGYLPDGRKPTLPEMLATRATKPYLIK